MKLRRTNTGSAIICALCTIFILSLIGATVLLNCAARYNVATKQAKAWKEALYAADAGGDIAFAEVRKLVSNPAAAFSGWTSGVPAPGPSGNGPYTLGQANSLSTSVTVDRLQPTPNPNGVFCYRIRATGTAKLLGLPRTGLDSALTASGTHFAANSATRGNGDTLLRKIDFNYDHFQATYGDGDMNNPTIQTVSNPQITRRIELIAAPQMASFTGALKVSGAFDGPGSAGRIDSWDSRPDTSTFSTGSGSTLNLPSGTTPGAPAQYVYSSLSGGLTINGRTLGGLGLVPVETYVTIVVGSAGSKTGDIGPITIGAGVNAKIYFTGSMNVKANGLANNNVDGAVGVFNTDGTPSIGFGRFSGGGSGGTSTCSNAAWSVRIPPTPAVVILNEVKDREGGRPRPRSRAACTAAPAHGPRDGRTPSMSEICPAIRATRA